MSSIEKSNNYWSVEMKTLEKVLKLPFENPEMTEEFFIPCAIFFWMQLSGGRSVYRSKT
jgi:hypothetical protein